MRRSARILAVLVLTLFGFQSAAQAGAGGLEARLANRDSTVEPAAHHPIYRPSYKVLNKKLISSTYTNKSKVIGRCTVQTNDSQCTISTGSSVSATINLALGASYKDVTGNLGFSASRTVTVNVSCTSPKLKKGQSWIAWSQGSRYSYQIRKTQPHRMGPSTVTTSGTLYAFNPRANAVTCGVG